MQLFEQPLERESERECESARESDGRSRYSLAWRVFARERKLTAECGLAALPATEVRKRRRSALPRAEAPDALASGACVENLGSTFCMELLPDGERIVALDVSGKLRVLAVKDSAPLWEVAAAHTSGEYGIAVPKLAVLGDGVVASGGSEDDYVRTWNADTGEQLCEIEVGGRGVFALAAIDSGRFAAGCRCGDISFYAHEQGRRLTQVFRCIDPKPHVDKLVVDFAVCGERLATVVSNGNVTIWDLRTQLRVAEIHEDDTGWLNGVDMSDSVVVTTSYHAPHVRVYSVANNYACVGAAGAFDWVHNRVGRSVRILGSGHVMSTSDDGTLAISALRSNEVVARMKFEFSPCVSAVLPDGSIAVTVSPVTRGYFNGIMIIPAPPAAASLLKASGDSKNRVTQC